MSKHYVDRNRTRICEHGMNKQTVFKKAMDVDVERMEGNSVEAFLKFEGILFEA